MDPERVLLVLRQRCRSLFLRGRLDDELDAELRDHLERQRDAFVASGRAEPEATRAALRAFGGVEQRKQEARDARGLRALEELLLDLRFAARTLRKSPVFTAVAVASLALGIGANTAIFSVIDALAFKPLPVPHPEQLVSFRLAGQPRDVTEFAHPQFREAQRRLSGFAGLAAATRSLDRYNVGASGEPAGQAEGRAFVQLVSGDYFPVLGVGAALGRTLGREDDRATGAHPVAVISHGYWQRRFHGASDVLERRLTLNDTSYAVVGVAAPGFSGEIIGRPTDVWLALAMGPRALPEAPDILTAPGADVLRVLGRVPPGSARQSVRAEAEAVWRQIERDARALDAEGVRGLERRRLELDPAGRFSPFRDRFAQPLAVLMSVVGLVLLIGCLNVATLLLARACARQREIAVRQSLGATRGRIVRQLLAEGLLLALPAGALGLIVARWTADAAAASMDAGAVFGSVHLELGLDPRLLAFCGVLSLASVLLFGLAPAWQASRDSLRPQASFRSGRGFVVTQMALSLVLLAGASLFVRSLRSLESPGAARPGGDPLLVWTRHGQTGLARGPALQALYRSARDRIAALPGVEAVTYSAHHLFQAAGESAIEIEGVACAPVSAAWDYVEPNFLRTLGIPLLRGRDFSDRDDDASAPPVAIVNQALARSCFGGEDPLGRRFRFKGAQGAGFEIIGVMRDSALNSPRARGQLEFYVPHRGGANIAGVVWLGVRSNAPTAGLTTLVEQELRRLEPRLGVLKANTLDAERRRALGQERLLASLSSGFGALALLLACLGLYGVLSVTVARRIREFGIRVALGATRGMLLRHVFWDSLRMALAGVALGVPATLWATRLLEARLFGVSGVDSLGLLAAGVGLAAVALLAAWLPARRAAGADPLHALRFE